MTAADRDRLHAIVANRNSPQKHVWRAAIVLATADGLGTSAVMRRTGKSKTAVWRWQERLGTATSTASCVRCTRPADVGDGEAAVEMFSALRKAMILWRVSLSRAASEEPARSVERSTGERTGTGACGRKRSGSFRRPHW